MKTRFFNWLMSLALGHYMRMAGGQNGMAVLTYTAKGGEWEVIVGWAKKEDESETAGA